jgi:hypothetical protein
LIRCNSASAGGQLEQPSDVKSSTRTTGAWAGDTPAAIGDTPDCAQAAPPHATTILVTILVVSHRIHSMLFFRSSGRIGKREGKRPQVESSGNPQKSPGRAKLLPGGRNSSRGVGF